jgi:hypothetical protein
MVWNTANRRNRWRWLYAAIAWFVLLGQLQLVFAAELHSHGYPAVSGQHTIKIAGAKSKSPPATPDGSLCVVCQIVRQSAARPTLNGPVIQLSGNVIFHPFAILTYFLNLSVSILPVRAPPLAE